MMEIVRDRMRAITIAVVVLVTIGGSAFGASSYTPASRMDNSLVQKAVHYSLPYPDESNINLSSSGKAVDQPLGLINPPSSQSPGMVIGNTWYDYQSNGTMGRQVDWGYDATFGYMVHFAWMYLPTREIGTDRAYAYTAYYSSDSSVPTFSPIQGSGDYAGYVELDAMDVTQWGGHGAAVGGHNNPGGGYAAEIYYEVDDPGVGFFASSRVTDSVQCYQVQTGNDYCAIWPTMRYQEVSGHDPVTHVFAQTSMPDAGDPQAIYYFRKVGLAEAGDWDYPPYIVDTVFDIAQDVACSNTSGKMALAWVANLVEDNLAACDTCSDNEGDSAVVNSQWENDLYYQVNTNYGDPGSWLPRVNLTKNLRDEEGYRPYTDLSILMGSNDDVHIAWSASIWEGRSGGIKDAWACRLFAWSENNYYTTGGDGFARANKQTVADLNYPSEDYPDCGPGFWNMLGCKMSISECNSRLYYVWVQYNDPANGVLDDCAQRAYDADDILGSANGELFLSVSTTLDGCLWDAPRNLTNSRANGCDSLLGTGGRCDSDNWPSMARHGSNHVGAKVVDSITVDPSGSYAGGYYLPVSYIADQDAGGIVQDEGSWQEADVVWFQLACVEPIDTKTLIPSLTSIGFPAYCMPNGSLDTAMIVENTGNQATSFTAAAAVTSAHPAGALTVTPTGGSITAGCTSTPFPLTIGLANGMITPAAGTAEKLEGTITFSGDFVGATRVIPVSFIVADTIVFEKWDTLYCNDGGSALALSVGNNGNFGQSGGVTGKVNLDYWLQNECAVWDEQNETNPYLEESRVYLYDGSPILCWDNGGEIDCNYSMYDYTFAGGGPNDGFYDGGFFPREDPVQAYPVWMTPQGVPDCQYTVTEFVSRDTMILIEQVTIAPNISGPQFVLQATKFTNLTGSTLTGLAIGEGVDWDIPSDSANWNGSGYDGSLNLMYQVGEEYSQDTMECTRNNGRFGGLAVLNIFEDGSTVPGDAQYGMYAMDNATQVYPLGHFSPDSLWNHMTNHTGFTTADSSQYNDLHMVATYRQNHTLAASGGNLIAYTLLATQQSGSSGDFETTVAEGKQWYVDNFTVGDTGCCVGMRGDVNYDGSGGGVPDIADLLYLVAYAFQEGAEPPCLPEADVNGWGGEGDIHDIEYLVRFMFQEGPDPLDCDSVGLPPVAGGSMSLDHVDGEVGPGLIAIDEPVTFHLRLTNSTPAAISAVTNGFRVYSSSGAQWDAVVGSYAPGYSSVDFDYFEFITLAGATGSGADTVGFTGVSWYGTGVAAGFDQVVYSIEIGSLSAAYVGRQICIDSAWYPPSNQWLWTNSASSTVLPSWSGPHCFTISAGSCCAERGDINHSGGSPDNADVSYLDDYLFAYGPPPPCMEEADADGCGDWGDLADLRHLAAYRDGSGPNPVPCGQTGACQTVSGGSVSIDHIYGQVGPSAITTDDSIVFYIRLDNATGHDMTSASNGFRIYSPTGADWANTTGSFTNALGSWIMDGDRTVVSQGVTGTGADTIAFASYAFDGNGLSNGFADAAYRIKLSGIDETYTGGQLCIDTCWYRPMGSWRWDAEGGTTTVPSWDGPHCFTIGGCLCGCGDVNANGQVTPSDFHNAKQYLFMNGMTPPNLALAEADGHNLFTVSDLARIQQCLYGPGPCPECPSSQGKLEGPIADGTFLFSFQSSYPPPDILPPGNNSFQVEFLLYTDTPLTVASLPVKIRVGPTIPTIDSVRIDTGSVYSFYQLFDIDVANATIDIALMSTKPEYDIAPGIRRIGYVYISVDEPPADSTWWRPILITLEPLGPTEQSELVNYPLLVGRDPDAGEVWTPTTVRFPCEGRRGNPTEPLDKPELDIADLIYYVTYMFQEGQSPVSFEEIDLVVDLKLDIADLIYLVTYMFMDGPEPPMCPEYGK